MPGSYCGGVSADAHPTQLTDRNPLARHAVSLGIAVVWLATLAAALWSPDMITGSQHEHLPLAAILGWLWASVATGYCLMARASTRSGAEASDAVGFVVGIAAVWVIMALASIFGPVLVTGTDPTQIPLVAIVAPLAAMSATGFICLHAAALPTGGH